MVKKQKEPPLELELPDQLNEAEEAIEVLRAWIADGALHVSLSADAFGPDTGSWGRMLAEISHHIAKAASLNGHMQNHEALAAIREAFEGSFISAGQGMSGKVKGRVKH